MDRSGLVSELWMLALAVERHDVEQEKPQLRISPEDQSICVLCLRSQVEPRLTGSSGELMTMNFRLS